MRIISKFKDYYDSALAYGADLSLIYDRKEETFGRGYRNGPSIPVHIAKAQEDIIKIYREDSLGGYGDPFTVRINRQVFTDNNAGIVGFCGNLYAYVRLTLVTGRPTPPIWVTPTAIHFAYSPTDEYLLPHINDDESKSKARGKRSWRLGNRSTGLKKRLEEFLEPRANLEIFRALQVPVFHMSAREFTLNPKLDDLQFWHARKGDLVMEPFTVMQELSMFIPNVLAPRDAPEPQITDDKVLATSKGFDKMSFRREKKENN